MNSDNHKLKYPIVRKVVQSTSLDVVGAVLILGVCYFRNFQGTIYLDGGLHFGVPFSELSTYVRQGAYPLGIMSMLGAVFSMLATRFVSKQKNTGNLIGIVTTVKSGANDFLFGNGSAIITYPLTFLTHSLAYKRWAEGEQIRSRDGLYYVIISMAMVIAFALVYLGAYLFGGKSEGIFLLTVAVAFGISLGATFSNAFKYQETWVSWSIYNVVQLAKNILLVNLANVVKYIFYLFNAALTLVDWTYNGDVTDARSSK